MAVYSYLALDADGNEHRGQIDAVDSREVAQLIRNQSLYVVDVSEGGSGTVRRSRLPRLRLPGVGRIGWSPGRYMPVKANDLVFFFRQLALLLRSGHTVVQALEIDQELITNKWLSDSIGRMAQAIRGGASFSAAMRQEKRLFSPVTASLVASGEAGGDLDVVLDRISDNLERSLALRRQLLTAMFYPTIVLLVSIGVIWGILQFVVPRYEQFFAARRLEMPVLMQAIIDISAWLEAYGQALLIVIGVSIFLVLAAYTTRRGKFAVDKVLLRVPLIGHAITLSAMAQFAIVMSMLLRSGMTVLDSLDVVRGVLGNLAIAASIERTGKAILAGNSLTASLRQPHIPRFVSHTASIGEKSGELDRVLDEMGRFFTNELEVKVKRIVMLIQPTMILIVGGIVAAIYFAIFQTVLRATTGALPGG